MHRDILVYFVDFLPLKQGNFWVYFVDPFFGPLCKGHLRMLCGLSALMMERTFLSTLWLFGPYTRDLSVSLVDFLADETHDEIQQEKEAESKESSPTHTGKRPDLFTGKRIIGVGFWGLGFLGGGGGGGGF
jgi:hypothetical protein